MTASRTDALVGTPRSDELWNELAIEKHADYVADRFFAFARTLECELSTALADKAAAESDRDAMDNTRRLKNVLNGFNLDSANYRGAVTRTIQA